MPLVLQSGGALTRPFPEFFQHLTPYHGNTEITKFFGTRSIKKVFSRPDPAQNYGKIFQLKNWPHIIGFPNFKLVKVTDTHRYAMIFHDGGFFLFGGEEDVGATGIKQDIIGRFDEQVLAFETFDQKLTKRHY